MLQTEPGQLGFGLCAGLDINDIGQPMKEPADHRDMARRRACHSLRLGRSGQHRRQRLTVERTPLTEIGGFMHPPGCLAPADPQPVSQHRRQLAAQLGRLSLGGELVDQGVFDGRLLTAKTLEPFQHGQPLGRGEHLERQVQGPFVVGLERVENLDDLFTTTRTHVRILSPSIDGSQSR